MNYSKYEREAMNAAFVKHFGVKDSNIVNSPAIQEWITNSATAIVEYDGSLKKEDRTKRDRRMEIVEVYDGSVSELVSYLRHLYPSKKGLTKWELIFDIHNEIMDVQPTIEQARLQTIFGTGDGSDDVPHEEEVGQDIPDTSNEDASVTEPAEAPQSDETPVEEFVHTSAPEEPVVPEVVTEPSDNHEEVPEARGTDDSSLSPSGNVQAQEDAPLFNKPNMEENKMSDIKELLASAAGSAPANVGDVQQAPASNTQAVKADVKAAQLAVSQLMSEEAASRQAWTQNNVVTAIISTQKPAAMRKTSDEGTVGTETDPTKQAQAIADKLTGFIAAVSGKKGITVEQFESLAATERYANVVPGVTKVNDVEVSNLDKAAAIYALLKTVKQNPAQTVPAFIPAKLSFPVKGYRVGGAVYSQDEFMLLLSDKSNGAIYAQGGVTPQGVEVDGATSFKLMTAKKAEKAQAGAIRTQTVERRVPVIRIKNKNNFIADGKNVDYLFTNEDAEQIGTAAFRAAISVNGVLVSAGVTVYALDEEGKKQVISHNDKTNEDRYKTKQASVSVSVPVKKVLREFAPEFKGNDDTVVAAGRWGVNMGASKAATADFCNIKEFSNTPIYDVFTQAFAGNLALSGKMKESESMKKLRSAANQAAAEAAADAEDALS